MPCTRIRHINVQNAYEEGHTHAQEITNLFVWNFKGELIHAAVNYPGSWHNSRLAASSELYTPLLGHHTPHGYTVLAGSASLQGGEFLERNLVRARKPISMATNAGCQRAHGYLT